MLARESIMISMRAMTSITIMITMKIIAQISKIQNPWFQDPFIHCQDMPYNNKSPASLQTMAKFLTFALKGQTIAT